MDKGKLTDASRNRREDEENQRVVFKNVLGIRNELSVVLDAFGEISFPSTEISHASTEILERSC